MKNKLVWLVLLFLALPHLGSSQEHLTNELHFEVNRVYPPISLTKEKLEEARTLIDLNAKYKSSWIREYVSVEILTNYKGKLRKAVGENEVLSQEQKDIMNLADLGSDISVIVQYVPENNLKHNDIQEIRFSLSVDPENEAIFPGGRQQLRQYLKEQAIDKIPGGRFENYDLATIKFTIDEKGQVIDPQIFWPFKDEKTDELLLNAICNMPDWKPAEYANGTKVKQEFVLTVGNMENCVVNLLNIRKY